MTKRSSFHRLVGLYFLSLQGFQFHQKVYILVFYLTLGEWLCQLLDTGVHQEVRVL